METKEVILSLSADQKKVNYKPREESTIKSFFSTARSYPIRSVPGFLYGGNTSTFKKHNKAVLNLIKQLNSSKVNKTDRLNSLERTHSLRVRSKDQKVGGKSSS